MPLHLYAIGDERVTPDDPSGLELIGRLELSEHDRMQRQWVAGDLQTWLPYFEDRRLTHANLSRLRASLVDAAAEHQPDSDLRRLVEVLDRALANGQGIATSAD